MQLTLLPLLATLGLTIAAPAPTSDLITATIFNGKACTGPGFQPFSIINTDCKPLTGQGLRVVGHDGGLRYNSLRVYKSNDCTGGWTLQPLNDACSNTEAFHSIRVVLE